MSAQRALMFSLGTFVGFAALIVVLFLALDVNMVLLVGPLLILGGSSVAVYRGARSDRG